MTMRSLRPMRNCIPHYPNLTRSELKIQDASNMIPQIELQFEPRTEVLNYSSQPEELEGVNILDVVRFLSDDYARMIILATTSRPMTAEEIAAWGSIPISSCYRRLQRLKARRIVEVRSSTTRPGKKTMFYKSRVRNLAVSFSANEMRAKFELDY